MRILFLDFDGPLVSMRSSLAAAGAPNRALDPVSVGLVARVCREAGARIVVSSIWRVHGRESVEADLRAAGLDVGLLHDDWRLDLPVGDRAVRVSAWLARHPEVEAYVCLDDNEVPGHPLVRVSSMDGVQTRHYLALLDALGAPYHPHLAEHVRFQIEREREAWPLPAPSAVTDRRP